MLEHAVKLARHRKTLLTVEIMRIPPFNVGLLCPFILASCSVDVACTEIKSNPVAHLTKSLAASAVCYPLQEQERAVPTGP